VIPDNVGNIDIYAIDPLQISTVNESGITSLKLHSTAISSSNLCKIANLPPHPPSLISPSTPVISLSAAKQPEFTAWPNFTASDFLSTISNETNDLVYSSIFSGNSMPGSEYSYFEGAERFDFIGPVATFTGGGGTGATADVAINQGVVQKVFMLNGGTGYTSAPTVTITGCNGTGATATANISSQAIGHIIDRRIVYPGTGYTTAPNITIVGGGGSGATFTATVAGGQITGVTITNPGSGYTTQEIYATITPVGSFTGNTATIILVVNIGQVFSTTLTNGGSGYNCVVEPNTADLFYSPNNQTTYYGHPSHETQVRNPNNILVHNNVDTSCIGVHYGFAQFTILITPRHAIQATHNAVGCNGTIPTYWFKDAKGNIYPRLIISRAYGPSINPDICILTFDSDLPASIIPAKVLPPNYLNYIQVDKYNTLVSKFPVYFLGINGQIKLNELYIPNGITTTPINFGTIASTDPLRVPWGKYLVRVSDSSSPIFTIFHNQIVAMGATTWTGPGSSGHLGVAGAFVNQLITAADSAAGISTGYTVTPVDLSSFAKYNTIATWSGSYTISTDHI
jgi:hypothetical protein